jgi:hypothetical protein
MLQKGEPMSDLISRQQAIDAFNTNVDELVVAGKENADSVEKYLNRVIDKIKELPSAQPDIIQCKDCKHFVRDDIEEHTPYGFYNTYFRAFCNKHWDEEQGEYIDVNLDDFCSFAERR